MKKENIKFFVEYGLDFDNNKFGIGCSVEIEYSNGREIRIKYNAKKAGKIHSHYIRIWIGKIVIILNSKKPNFSIKKKKRWNFKIVYGNLRFK